MAEAFTCKAAVLLRFRRLPEMNLGRLRTFTPEGGPSEKPQNLGDDVTMAASGPSIQNRIYPECT